MSFASVCRLSSSSAAGQASYHFLSSDIHGLVMVIRCYRHLSYACLRVSSFLPHSFRCPPLKFLPLPADAVALRKRLNSSGPSLEIIRSVFRLIILSFTRTAAFTAILAGAAAVTTQIFGTDDMKYYEISWAFLGALCPVYGAFPSFFSFCLSN
jgi:hypothetical protein